MDPARYQRINDLFFEAAELEETRREAFLRRTCADDSEVLERVRALLQREQRQDVTPLDQPAPGAGILRDVAGPGAVQAQGQCLPSSLGGYRILRIIGEGGMGTVYEAQQETPKRRVALKVIRTGMASRKVLKRFKHEADILGQLQHPGIAHIYEAGFSSSDEGGQPFFAMEFIDGRPIDEYADGKRLMARQRLELIARVCDAVEHAHIRGIVHRDLKPANVLVVEQETAPLTGNGTTIGRNTKSRGTVDLIGQPKILDFGIARLTHSDVESATLQTDAGQIVGTLAYMSPEQVAGISRDLDTRCDVYSLGVVLYELITGRLPFDLAGRTIAEVARFITEVDPPRARSVDLAVNPDLDTIIAKAMEKDRERRYASAAALAADIRRYLSDEPIEARPASAFYQFRKFARRNRALVGGLVTTMLAIVIGGVLALYYAVNANRNAAEAIAQRDSAEAVTAFFADMLAAADPHVQSRDITVREALGKAAADIDQHFDGQPLIEARLRTTMGETYRGLGDYDAAEQQLSKALDTRKGLLGLNHRDTLQTQAILGEVYYFQGHLDRATITCEAAWDQSRRALNEHDEVRTLAANAVAFMYMQTGRFAEAESLFKKTLAAVFQDDEESLLVLEIQSNLALLYTRMNRTDEAVPLYTRIIEISMRVRSANHPSTILLMANLASLYLGTNQTELALPILEDVLEIQRKSLGGHHSQTLITLNNLANANRRLKRFDLAERMYRDGIETARAAYGDEHPSALMFRLNLGSFLSDFRRYDEAKPMLMETYEQHRKTFGDEHQRTKDAKRKLSELMVAIGDVPD